MKNILSRLTMLWLHRWTGLTAGLVLMMLATTGSMMLFRPQIEPLMQPDLLTVPSCLGRATIEALTSAAQTAHPEGKLDFVRLESYAAAAERMPAGFVRFKDKTTVYLNPCTAQVLGQRNRYSGLFGTIEGLHRLRFVEDGEVITGTTALLTVLLLIGGGYYLWWPATRRGLRSAMRHDRSLRGPARTLNLHRTVGLYVGLIVLASALTGLPQAFKWYKQLLYSATGSAKPAKSPHSAAPGKRIELERAWLIGQQIVPGASVSQLRYPEKPNDAIELFFIGRDAPHPNARTMLYLDAVTGATLRLDPYASSSAGNKLYFWMLSWHNGLVGGAFGQWLMLFGLLGVPVLGYTGFSSFLRRQLRRAAPGHLTVRVASRVRETGDIVRFELEAPDGGPLPSFVAGAHIEVFLKRGLVRQYSICNSPRESHRYVIAVLRDAKSRGGSSMMHKQVRVGDLLEIGMPRNHFPLAADAGESVLVAGGIGITPLLSMAEHLADSGAAFRLHYRARSRASMAFADYIEKSRFAGNATLHLSDGAPEQLMNLDMLLADPAPGRHLYVCGPKGFMETVLATAEHLGWSNANLHREFFANEVVSNSTDLPFVVHALRSGKVIPIASGQTALQGLAAAGVKVPRSCEQGVCGTCLTKVLEGQPDHRDLYLNDAQRASNACFLPCCSRSLTPLLVLDI
jgi:ferredoxin-NADP reductase